MKQIIVIGGGISGLATAYLILQQAQEQGVALQVKLIERESRIGGKVWSRYEDNYLCEWGPNGFLTNKPQTLELCRNLGISEHLLASNDNASKRFVYANGKLHKLPHNQIEFLSSSLISLAGKLRIAKEFFIKQRKSITDESLADFARRRLGDEALTKLIAPMAGGIFAGDPEQMSLQACFPRVHQLEQEYGSLLKAMLKLMKKNRLAQKTGVVTASPSGYGGTLTSFMAGLQTLTDKLSSKIGASNIIQEEQVIEVKPGVTSRWQIVAQKQVYYADKVVLATPSYATALFLAKTAPVLSQQLQQINYSPLIVICLAYDLQNIDYDLNGFGYLLARGESIPVLGTLWDSSIFASRAPDGKVLFRTMLGGAVRPDLLQLSDFELQQLAQKSLLTIMGIECEPEMVKIYRHEKAIPQYRLGHTQLIDSIQDSISKLPNLYLAGNAYFGVGINDCVATAYKVANSVINDLNN